MKMGVVESLRVAGAAAGVFMTLVIALLIVVAVKSSASEEPSTQSELLRQLSLLYKGTYVLYGKGRRSERDLPVCATPGEACNLAHRRFWLTPITERLCRCSDRSECPLHFTGLNDSSSQHVSNRAQLKFCGNIMEELEDCTMGQPALTLRRVERENPAYPSSVTTEGFNTHSSIKCRCPWPRKWTLTETRIPSPTETIFLYTCDELPQCKVGEECGHIRADTLESYYSCSCPENHMCVFSGPQPTQPTTQLHFKGEAYIPKCTPN